MIKHNTVVSGQVSGIAVGQTQGLSIYDNTILQDTKFPSREEVHIPVIRVNAESTGVRITSNTLHRVPEPSGPNWFPTDRPEPGWTIANNKLVPLGTTPAQASNARASLADTDSFRFEAAGEANVDQGPGSARSDPLSHRGGGGRSPAADGLAPDVAWRARRRRRGGDPRLDGDHSGVDHAVHHIELAHAYL